MSEIINENVLPAYLVEVIKRKMSHLDHEVRIVNADNLSCATMASMHSGRYIIAPCWSQSKDRFADHGIELTVIVNTSIFNLLTKEDQLMMVYCAASRLVQLASGIEVDNYNTNLSVLSKLKTMIPSFCQRFTHKRNSRRLAYRRTRDHQRVAYNHIVTN